MTHFMQKLLWHSLAMSVIVLAYYAATVFLRRRYAAKWLYLSGVILLLGFLVPFRPVVTVQPKTPPAFSRSETVLTETEQLNTPATQPIIWQAAQGSPWTIAFTVWAVGALLTVLYHGVKHIRFMRAVLRWRTDVKDARLLSLFEKARRSLMIDDRNIDFAFCECIRSPMLVYLKKPTVLLPKSEQTPYDPLFILSHELTHYKRKDLLCRFLMLLTTAIHWFNPAIYFLVRLVTIQCEISCDEKVVEGQDIEARHQYAMSIISVARCHSKNYTLLTTCFNGGKNIMKQRINIVYKPAKKRISVFLLVCTLVITLLAGTSIATGDNETKYILPENPVKFNEKLDSYIVSWEAMDGIKEYLIGVYYNIQFEETAFNFPPVFGTDGKVIQEATKSEPTTGFWKVSTGWIGNGTVTDNAGNEYEVLGCWEAAKLPGDATEVDLSEMINNQLDPIGIDYDPVTFEFNKFANKQALLGCTMKMVAVREVGEPIVVDIEIPVE